MLYICNIVILNIVYFSMNIDFVLRNYFRDFNKNYEYFLLKKRKNIDIERREDYG